MTKLTKNFTRKFLHFSNLIAWNNKNGTENNVPYKIIHLKMLYKRTCTCAVLIHDDNDAATSSSIQYRNPMKHSLFSHSNNYTT